jgi:hypothetical protein
LQKTIKIQIQSIPSQSLPKIQPITQKNQPKSSQTPKTVNTFHKQKTLQKSQAPKFTKPLPANSAAAAERRVSAPALQTIFRRRRRAGQT